MQEKILCLSAQLKGLLLSATIESHSLKYLDFRLRSPVSVANDIALSVIPAAEIASKMNVSA